MTFPPEKVRRIHTHEGGWEDDWRELWELILERVQERAPQIVRRASPELLHQEPQIVDHFVNWLMVFYSARVSRCTLLQSWCATDHGDADVVAWLTTWDFLQWRFLDFLGEEGYANGSCGDAIYTGIDGRGQEGDSQRIISDERVRRWEARVAKAIRDTELPVPKEGKRVPRAVETAGLELYPRLDWSKPSHERLLHHLQEVLVDRDDEGLGKLEVLEASHERASQAIRQRHEEVEERLYEMYEEGRDVSRREELKLRRRQDRLRVQLVFWPLEAEDVQGLLDVSEGNAHQILSRYRRSLGRLVPELARLYELGPSEDLGEEE